MIFDSHAHYDDDAFDIDREQLLAQLPASGVTRVVNVGSSARTTEQSLALAHKYDYIYAAVGIHPSDVLDYEEGRSVIAIGSDGARGELKTVDMDWLCEAAADKKAVAIGEIGLDYYWDEPEREIQKRWFREQLRVARDLDKPIIIHSRDAAKDTFDIMKEMGGDKLKAVIHCFSYEPEMAQEFLKLGYYIGIGGVLTYKNARKQKEVLSQMPLERLLLETDCPYLTPVPHRGERNSSLMLPLVIKEMAQIRGISEEEIERITYENANRFYEIKD